MLVIFWIIAFILVWAYMGYPGLLFILSKMKRAEHYFPTETFEPNISIVIAAFNEQASIKKRIENCYHLDYPKGKLEVVVGSDGSKDKTAETVRNLRNDRVKILEFPERRGRAAVNNDCVKEAFGEIIFFTDASTRYRKDCIRKMIRHYLDPRVGAVGGELVSESFAETSLGLGQGAYWRYEYFLRRVQSKLNILYKISGANMSVRKVLYRALPEMIDIDLGVGPNTVLQGYRVIHEKEAIAYESFPTGLSPVLSAKERHTLRGLTALLFYKKILNPFKHPLISMNYISYEVLRYLTPFFLMGIYLSNLCLLEHGWFYNVVFISQTLFYVAALFGFVLEGQKVKHNPFSLPFSLCFFELSIFWGVIQFIRGKKITFYNPIH